MPGLVGIVTDIPAQGMPRVIKGLLLPMQRGKHLKTEMDIDPGRHWALGRVHLGVLQPQPQLIAHGGCRVLFHGDLHNQDELREELKNQEGSPIRSGTVSLISALYQANGTEFVRRLKGAFCGVVLDLKARKLVLVNDPLGSYPLYWHCDRHHFVFASELKAILPDPTIKPSLDAHAVADYLTFGFLLGEKTLAESIQLLPPASILTYGWEDGSCHLDRYARVEELFQSSHRTKAEYEEELCQEFNRAVGRSLKGDHCVGLALSGGLDSRAILSAVNGAGKSIPTYTLGAKGCADEVIAAQLAQLAGTKHQFEELDTTYLGEFVPNLQRMVQLTDGMYLTHGLTEMLALRSIEKGGFDLLLRGHGAELAKTSLAWPLHTDSRIHQMKRKDEFIPYMLDRVNYISRNVPLSGLFSDEWWKQVAEGPARSLETSLSNIELAPADLCSYLYLMEHHRRFTVSSLELFRNLVEVRLPFVDLEFLRVLWSGPSLWRDSTDLHRVIIGQNQRALLRVRNSNTGAPGDASRFVETIFDKVNSLFKRLNIYGYRHYHTFDRWMKQSLIAAVEEVLLDPKTLGRGQYRETGLRQLLSETREGRADHAYLFQILLILELWQREDV